MHTHPNATRCAQLVDETTRLRLAIDEREQYQGLHAQQQSARLWIQYHRAMVELLALTPAVNHDAAERQKRTADGHEAEKVRWMLVAQQLDQEVTS